MGNLRKVGRNEPCPCVSGKKYKNCCMSEEQLQLEGFPYYQTAIGPKLKQFLEENFENKQNTEFIHRRLE